MRLEKQTRNRTQRGIAMIMALLALFLLALIGIAFMTMTNTENSANRNYKDSQKAYFASRAGLESARALMVPPNARTGLGAGPLYAPAIALDGQMPSSTAKSMIYWGNSTDPAAADIDPTARSSPPPVTVDDELCQELYGGLGLTAPTQPTWSAQAAAVPCGSGGSGELLTSQTPYGKVISAAGQIPDAGGASVLPFKWVRITNKQNFMGLLGQPLPTSTATTTYGYQVCWDGTREQVIPPGQTCVAQLPFEMRPVWLLTSLSVTPGGSRRMTQMEVALTPPITVNATVATNGPIALKGNLTVTGNDNCSNNSFNAIYSGACVPGQNGCTGNSITQMGGSSETLTGNSNVPGVVQNVLTTYNPDGTVAQQGVTGQGTWPYHVDDLINAFSQIAQPATGDPWNFKCANGNCGTQSNPPPFGKFPTNPLDPSSGTPVPVYIPGSVTLHGNGTSGDGILIVNGDLTVDGGLQYYGLILVKGQIHFTGGGSAPVNLYGAILAGDKVSATDTIGGSFDFKYSSCALRQNTPQIPPRVLASHEVVF